MYTFVKLVNLGFWFGSSFASIESLFWSSRGCPFSPLLLAQTSLSLFLSFSAAASSAASVFVGEKRGRGEGCGSIFCSVCCYEAKCTTEVKTEERRRKETRCWVYSGVLADGCCIFLSFFISFFSLSEIRVSGCACVPPSDTPSQSR